MSFSSKETQSIIDLSFCIDFLDLKLEQQNTMENQTAIIYQGTGSVSFDPSGQLTLKMYHKNNEPSHTHAFQFLALNQTSRAGQIFGQHFYFSLSGSDINGDLWESRDILISGGTSSSAYGTVINKNLAYIQKKDDIEIDSQTTAFLDVLDSEHEIPYNEYKQQGDVTTLSNYKKNIGEQEILISREKEHTVLIYKNSAITTMEDLININKILLESINIAIGKRPAHLISVKKCSGLEISTIYSRKKSDKKLPTPFHLFYSDTKSFDNFLESYLTHTFSAGSSFYAFWHRILTQQNTDLENMGLVIGVAIEGVLNEYFSDYYQIATEDLKQIEEARAALRSNTVSIDQDIKNRLLSSLAFYKKSTPKKILTNLIQSKIITEELLSFWEEIRHKSAHAVQLEQDQIAIQIYLNGFHACLELFYRLLFQKIEYQGKFYEYSKEGFPIGEIKTDTLISR